jgi:hypothetical protein
MNPAAARARLAGTGFVMSSSLPTASSASTRRRTKYSARSSSAGHRSNCRNAFAVLSVVNDDVVPRAVLLSGRIDVAIGEQQIEQALGSSSAGTSLLKEWQHRESAVAFIAMAKGAAEHLLRTTAACTPHNRHSTPAPGKLQSPNATGARALPADGKCGDTSGGPADLRKQ